MSKLYNYLKIYRNHKRFCCLSVILNIQFVNFVYVCLSARTRTAYLLPTPPCNFTYNTS